MKSRRKTSLYRENRYPVVETNTSPKVQTENLTEEMKSTLRKEILEILAKNQKKCWN